MSLASAALAKFVRDHLSDEEILELVRAWLVREVPARRLLGRALDAEAAAIVLGSIQGAPPPDEAMMGLVRKRLG